MSIADLQKESQGEGRGRRSGGGTRTWQEVALIQDAPAWFQVCRNDNCTSGKGRVAFLHRDALGLRLVTEQPVPRGAELLIQVTLPTMGTLHARGVAEQTNRQASTHYTAVRFRHLAEVDRQALSRLVEARLHAAEQPPTASRHAAPRLDNRRYQRYMRSVPVEYQVCDAEGRMHPGQGQMVTLNIGGGGLKFRVTQPLAVGDTLYVRLPLGQDVFYSLGRIVWTETSRVPGRLLAGLQFVELPAQEQERLLAHLGAVPEGPER